MYYLNTDTPMLLFQNILNSDIYVDKSKLIEKISAQMRKGNQYICITRPRRFGKTVNANMLGAYYTKGIDSAFLFDRLAVSKTPEYQQHLNRHNVIYIDFSRMPDFCESYKEYIGSILKKLQLDLIEAYPVLKNKEYDSISEVLRDTRDRFVFILDEWDCVFYQKFVREKDKSLYLSFLKGLLKDQPYVELAYMTGVLPIAKYSSGSELNMFREYNFMNDSIYEAYFGLSGKEVDKLCETFKSISYAELKFWYDGYYLSNGESLFNPRSVNCALSDGICKNYWTQTGPMNEIAECIEHNVDEVREDIVRLVSGIPVEVELKGYSAVEQQLNSRNEILSAMVVYGFLSYHEGMLQIPNHELMEKFQEVLLRKSMGDVSEIVGDSKKMVEATLACDEKKVAQILENIHDREIPFLAYNDENALSCVITLCYLYARNDYRIEREEKSGKGYCDYMFYPKKSKKPAIILELKVDCTASEAVCQIKARNYMQKVEKYKNILLVGISYQKKDKKHTCVIEKWQNPDRRESKICEKKEQKKEWLDRKKSSIKYANRISEISNAFSPGPLLPGQMAEFYCSDTMECRMGDKYSSPMEDIYDICRESGENQAFMLLGHRGSGKSTELNRLSERLIADGYPVKAVMCSIELDLLHVTCTDFFILMGEALLQIAQELGCGIEDNILGNIADFWKEGTQNIISQEFCSKTGISVGTSEIFQTVLKLLARMKADLKYNDEMRKVYQRKIRLHTREWIKILSQVSEKIEEKTGGKHPIIIFEDLDKMSLEKVWHVLYHNVTILSNMPFSVIYTFPAALRYHERFSVMESYFIVKTLPMIKIEMIDGQPFPEGVQVIRKIVEKRASRELFEAGVLDRLIQYTGGSLRDLFHVINASAKRAVRREGAKISVEDAEWALEELKISLTRKIETKDYKFLLNIYNGNKELIEDKEMLQKMMHASVVLEYNGKRWHNVHPLLVKFFKDQGLIADTRK